MASERESMVIRAMWLQAVMSRRMVTDKEARIIYNSACRAVGVPTDRYRDDINIVMDELGNIGLELRQMQDEVDGRTLVGVVNAKGDALAQAGTGYLPAELVYIKAVIEAIYTAPRSTYSISSLEALALPADHTVTKKAREEILANLVRHDWLRKSKGGRYALGTRALMELQSYLKNEYEDNALQCYICNDLITMGNVCSTDTPELSCVVQVHHHCEPRLKTKASALHLPGKCPECKHDWAPWPFGLRAAEELARRQPAFNNSTTALAADDDNFDDVEQPTQQAATTSASASASRKRTNRSSGATSGRGGAGKKRTKRRTRDGDDDDDDEEDGVGEGGTEEDDEEEDAYAPRASTSRRTSSSSRRRTSTRSGQVRVAGGLLLDEAEDDDEDED